MSSAFATSELQLEGVVPEPFEAVAVVLSLMDRERDGQRDSQRAEIGHDGEQQDTPARPSLATLYLTRDGDVYSKTPGRFSIVDLGTLLKQMLERTPQVPPGLLFGIARALRAVEAPAFESADAFARVLARFERGPRRDVVSNLVARFEAALDSKPAGAPRVERRGTSRLVSHLRQELRAADRHLYEKRVVVVPVMRADQPPASRGLKHLELTAVAVCFVAGLASFAIGDSLHMQRRPTPVQQQIVAAAPSAITAAPAPAVERPPSGATVSRSDSASGRVKRVRVTTARPNRSSRLLTVLRLGWIRRLALRNNL